jgi:hypothetical protein
MLSRLQTAIRLGLPPAATVAAVVLIKLLAAAVTQATQSGLLLCNLKCHKLQECSVLLMMIPGLGLLPMGMPAGQTTQGTLVVLLLRAVRGWHPAVLHMCGWVVASRACWY